MDWTKLVVLKVSIRWMSEIVCSVWHLSFATWFWLVHLSLYLSFISCGMLWPPLHDYMRSCILRKLWAYLEVVDMKVYGWSSGYLLIIFLVICSLLTVGSRFPGGRGISIFSMSCSFLAILRFQGYGTMKSSSFLMKRLKASALVHIIF